MKENKKNAVQIMAGLIGMIKPLLGVMVIAITLGCLGHLAATFITVLGGVGLLSVVGMEGKLTLSVIIFLMVLFAVIRGILRYGEQASNHYIAFKLLARIRNKVFEALRKLAPAKLDGLDKGNLISILTSDIELLEVFYAHTISPIAIAIITSIIMVFFIGFIHPVLGGVAALFYFIVGVVIPIINGRLGNKIGKQYREEFGDLNTVALQNLYGLDEILQYHQGDKRLVTLQDKTKRLEAMNKELRKNENRQRIATDSGILIAGAAILLVSLVLINQDQLVFSDGFIAVITILSSFGPTAALSALSNNLTQTLASGERVLNLLEEVPVVEDVVSKTNTIQKDVTCKKISFTYHGTEKKILDQLNLQLEDNKIHGIHGKSGCGKSTLLKLLQRFYQVDEGEILYGNDNINDIDTKSIRNHIAYVTQDTFLFQDTIENNMKIAKENATSDEIVTACKKASIHEFITSLPNGYETKLSELGSSLSGGERQRLGIARAFLHNSNMILLDEPTSNIDSLNEKIILKSLREETKDKTVLFVSHRKSTMGIADIVINM